MAAPFRATQTFLFQPTQISGCTVWLDGADPNGNGTLPANGSVVSSWLDKSSNGMTVSAASSQPTYSTNVQNGLGALTFDGTRNLTTGNVAASKFAGNTLNLTIFCVFSLSNTVTGTTYASPFCFANGTGVPRICLSIENTANGVMMDVGSNSIGRTSFSVPPPTFDNTFYFTSYWKNGANTQINLNGSTKATSTSQPTDQFGSSIFPFNVGNGYTTPAYFMRGNVGEILFYNTTLSTQNFQLVEGYLAWKWGLQSSLPITHPYYNTPVYSPQPFPLVPRVPFATNNPVFVPTQVSGCTLWLDAADASTITGSPITTWRDKSGLANNATATVGPTQSTYSGYPVVTFNGSTQFMNSPNTVPRTTHTLIAVHRPVTITANFQGNTSLFRYQATNYIVFPYMNGTTPRGYITSADGAGAGSIDFGNSTLVENSVTTSFNLILAVIQSGSQQIFKNGTLQSSDTETLTGATSDSLTVGRWTPGLSEYYQGDLGEMIVYSGALSQANRQQVEGYLAWKWGLTSSLPVGHPFRVPPIAPFPFVVRQARQGVFSPNSIAGLSLWLDAADPSTVSLSGNTVTDVLDKSPANVNLSNALGFTYPNNTFNGTRPSFFVSGGGNSGGGTQRLGVNSAFALATPFTVCFVCQHVGAANYGYILDSATGAGRPYILDAGAGPRFETPFGSGGLVTTSPLLNVFIFGSSAALFQNGTQQYTGSATFTTGGITVGNRFTLNESWPGHICELTIHNSSLTTLQRQQVEGYLAWKWGLQANLPGNHPYKLFPPAPT
jgi:hypothetical protein